jgi:hypothetical protein
MPYPSAAIQTPFTATASPMPATGQAVRIASTAFVTMTLLPSLIARGFSFAKAAGHGTRNTFPPQCTPSCGLSLPLKVDAWLGSRWNAVRGRFLNGARTLAEGSVRRAGPRGYLLSMRSRLPAPATPAATLCARTSASSTAGRPTVLRYRQRHNRRSAKNSGPAPVAMQPLEHADGASHLFSHQSTVSVTGGG